MEQFVQLVGQARGDLSLPWLSQTDLASIRARLRLAEMATGQVAPVKGANRLWADRERFGDPFGILPQLIELVDRWETSLNERDSIEDEIRAVARGPSCERKAPQSLGRLDGVAARRGARREQSGIDQL